MGDLALERIDDAHLVSAPVVRRATGLREQSKRMSVFTDPSSPIGLADNEITCDADSSAPLCAAAGPL